MNRQALFAIVIGLALLGGLLFLVPARTKPASAGPLLQSTGDAYPGPGTETPDNDPYPGPETATLAVTPGPTHPRTTTPGVPAATTQAFQETPEEFPTLESQVDDGLPTATLIPFPTYTIEFPEMTKPANSLAAAGAPRSPSPDGGGKRPSLTAVGLLAVIWLVLGGWFYFSQRRLG